MALELPQITLIAITNKDFQAHKYAIDESCRDIRWGAVKLIWDESIKSIDDWNYKIIYELHHYLHGAMSFSITTLSALRGRFREITTRTLRRTGNSYESATVFLSAQRGYLNYHRNWDLNGSLTTGIPMRTASFASTIVKYCKSMGASSPRSMWQNTSAESTQSLKTRD